MCADLLEVVSPSPHLDKEANIPQTTKARGQTTYSATGVRLVSGLQAASLSTLESSSTSSNVSNSVTRISVHASSNSFKNTNYHNSSINNSNKNNNFNDSTKESAFFSLNLLGEALDVKFNEFFNKHASKPAEDADLLKNPLLY